MDIGGIENIYGGMVVVREIGWIFGDEGFVGCFVLRVVKFF